MEPTVFYAWQSDADQPTTRSLIKRAAEKALKAISADATVEDSPRLDHDTKGESGTPEISGTIFEKIKSAGLFFADVTLVGKIEPEKRTPNPNVLIELGYAAAVLGWRRVILVMNKHYGPPEDLSFDLKNRRFPLTYTLAPGDAKGDTMGPLSDRLEEAIRTAMNEEHDLVQTVADQLTIECFEMVRKHAAHDFFYVKEPQVMAEFMTSARSYAAVDRLLTLRVVRYYDDGENRGYVWTYLGTMLLRRLGFK